MFNVADQTRKRAGLLLFTRLRRHGREQVATVSGFSFSLTQHCYLLYLKH